ncbi:thioredoxin family protein [Georgenia sp. AZ-5]|uniref:thioredoxin family protein n=1 Tax=Georgenia sp. AZ-5 TaxID=3367526 RepID=UPI0037540FFA
MNIELLYIDGCPSWTVALSRLAHVLENCGLGDEPVDLVRVSTNEQARSINFRGSPTIRINGHDPFPCPGDCLLTHCCPDTGLPCRVYVTPDGIAGAPTTDQLIHAILQADDYLN